MCTLVLLEGQQMATIGKSDFSPLNPCNLHIVLIYTLRVDLKLNHCFNNIHPLLFVLKRYIDVLEKCTQIKLKKKKHLKSTT